MAEENNRLNYQHTLLKEIHGGLLDQEIRINEKMRVADVGTGTWYVVYFLYRNSVLILRNAAFP